VEYTEFRPTDAPRPCVCKEGLVAQVEAAHYRATQAGDDELAAELLVKRALVVAAETDEDALVAFAPEPEPAPLVGRPNYDPAAVVADPEVEA
jgi:hypothetical protein